MAHYGFGMPVRALPISRYLEMPRETVRRVDWWRSVCLNAQRIKPSSLARNSIGLRLSAPYDCFARELRDYCEYRLACPIVLDTRKKPGGIHNTVARARIPIRGAPKPGRSAY